MARVHQSSEPYRQYDKGQGSLGGLFRVEIEDKQTGQLTTPQTYHCVMCDGFFPDPDGKFLCLNPDCEDFQTPEDVEFQRQQNLVMRSIEEEPFIEDER